MNCLSYDLFELWIVWVINCSSYKLFELWIISVINCLGYVKMCKQIEWIFSGGNISSNPFVFDWFY